MNDNWIAMMVYAPLTKESVDTDYQKEEDFKEEDVDAAAVAEKPDYVFPSLDEVDHVMFG